MSIYSEIERIVREVDTQETDLASVESQLAEALTLLDGKASGGGGSDDTLDKLIEGTLTEIQSNATKIRAYAFYLSSSLATANFPLVTSVGSYAFYACPKLATANFPLATEIRERAFYNCFGLATADFPLVTSVGSYAFYACSKLATANFPSATEIGERMFNNCSNLTTANFPSATEIKELAFNSCFSLTALILRSETMVTLSNPNVFYGCYHLYGTVNSTYNPTGAKDGYIYVPRALVEDYKVDVNWSKHATQFRALEDYTVDGTITGELDESKI